MISTARLIVRFGLVLAGIAAFAFGAHARQYFSCGGSGPYEGPSSYLTHGGVWAAAPWDPDGPGPLPEVLVVSGWFDAVGNTPFSNIATWDGNDWSALGNGLPNQLHSLCVANNQLYVTANSTTAWKAWHWNGNAFEQVPILQPNFTEVGCVSWNGKLVIAGTPTGSYVSAIATWDGDTPGAIPLPDPYSKIVRLGTYQGTLIAVTSGWPLWYAVYSWDGSQWTLIGTAAGNASNGFAIEGIMEYRGDLYVSGEFTSMNGVACTSVARWNGSDWSPIAANLGGGVNLMGVARDTLFLISNDRLRTWDGAASGDFGSFAAGSPTSLCEFGGELICGGGFTELASVWTGPIARFDGETVRPLAHQNDRSQSINALALYNNEVAAVGSFDNIDGVPAQSAASWNGEGWYALGGGLSGGAATCAIVYQGDLIVGGDFDGADGAPANAIARWNGSAWQPMGTGMNAPVRALAVLGNTLYAGGEFTTAGGVNTPYIAKWNGTTWSTIGTGANGPVYALHVPTNDQLYVGGAFTKLGSANANRIARTNGFTVTGVGTGANGAVRAITSLHGTVYIGGDFSIVGGVSATGVAAYTPNTWSAFSPGVTGQIVQLRISLTEKVMAYGHTTNSNNGVVACTLEELSSFGAFCRLTDTTISLNDEVQYKGDTIRAGSIQFDRYGPTPYYRRDTDPFNPWFSSQPEDSWAIRGGRASVAVTMQPGYFDTNHPNVFRWRRNGTPVNNGPAGASPGGGTVSGATTEVLVIDNAKDSDAGNYDVILNNTCTSITSNAATLSIRCNHADVNSDGLLDLSDFFDFLNCFDQSQPCADVDGGGDVSLEDFFLFLNDFDAGC